MTEMEWREIFRHDLRIMYKKKGFRNQKEFAIAAGISERTMTRIMNCTITARPNLVRTFAEVLNCDVKDIAPLEYTKIVQL